MQGDGYSHDCYSFFKQMKPCNVFEKADMWHKGIAELFRLLFEKLGRKEDFFSGNTPLSYYNYWVLKSELYEQYVKEWLAPSMELLENDSELKEIAMQNAKYMNLERTSESPERCLEIFGVPHYTYHPFVLERLISAFLMAEGLTLKHL